MTAEKITVFILIIMFGAAVAGGWALFAYMMFGAQLTLAEGLGLSAFHYAVMCIYHEYFNPQRKK